MLWEYLNICLSVTKLTASPSLMKREYVHVFIMLSCFTLIVTYLAYCNSHHVDDWLTIIIAR